MTQGGVDEAAGSKKHNWEKFYVGAFSSGSTLPWTILPFFPLHTLVGRYCQWLNVNTLLTPYTHFTFQALNIKFGMEKKPQVHFMTISFYVVCVASTHFLLASGRLVSFFFVEQVLSNQNQEVLS